MAGRLNAALNVYPNPTKGIFNLMVSDFSTGKALVKVSDVAGKIIAIKDVKIVGKQQIINMNIENAAPGMYSIEVIQADHKKTINIVKE